MELNDPVAAYNAANNIEAYLVCELLQDAGINAHVVEDVSVVGIWFGGLLPEIHKPQVWIGRNDVERAKPVLTAYEDTAEKRRQEVAGRDPIVVTCEECGVAATFPASQIDSVQCCHNCGAFVDVEEP